MFQLLSDASKCGVLIKLIWSCSCWKCKNYKMVFNQPENSVNVVCFCSFVKLNGEVAIKSI